MIQRIIDSINASEWFSSICEQLAQGCISKHPKYAFGMLTMLLENRNWFIIIKLNASPDKKNNTIHKEMCYKRFNQFIKKIRFKEWLIHESDIARIKTYAWLTHKPAALLAIRSNVYTLFCVKECFNRKRSVKAQSPADLLGSARVLLWIMGSPYLRSASEKYVMQ